MHIHVRTHTHTLITYTHHNVPIGTSALCPRSQVEEFESDEDDGGTLGLVDSDEGSASSRHTSRSR